AGLVLATAARGAAQSQVEFTDHTPAEQQATAYLPGGTAFPGEAIDGSLAPVVEREVVFTGPVDVSLVGVTPGGELTLRHAAGGPERRSGARGRPRLSRGAPRQREDNRAFGGRTLHPPKPLKRDSDHAVHEDGGAGRAAHGVGRRVARGAGADDGPLGRD